MSARDREQPQAANLARHLNDRYADSLLFLARCAAELPGASTAFATSLTVAGLDLQVDGEPVHVPLPVNETDDPRAACASACAEREQPTLTLL